MDRMVARVTDLIRQTPTGTMLHPIILESFQDGIRKAQNISGVEMHASQNHPDASKTEAQAVAFVTDAQTFLRNPALHGEVFGPSTIIVRCREKEELEKIAGTLEGHLTAAIHGTAEDLADNQKLVGLLERKVGRLIFNGFPTGVEVCPSMQHGGPYPATTDAKFTSVGTAAIKRFVRPICYQNFPQVFLPLELQDINARRIWRLLDGAWSKDNG
jgi:NADP-dependent aldehyde dehydrogenase